MSPAPADSSPCVRDGNAPLRALERHRSRNFLQSLTMAAAASGLGATENEVEAERRIGDEEQLRACALERLSSTLGLEPQDNAAAKAHVEVPVREDG